MLAEDLKLSNDLSRLTDVALTDQQAEYVRLFINGPGGVAAPPYASVYINNSGILLQQGYDQAVRFYRQAGLVVESMEPADHITNELAFVGMLLDQEEDHLLTNFVKKHLNLWLPSFFQQLLQSQPFVFYKVLAQVTDLCLQQLIKEVMHEQTTFS